MQFPHKTQLDPIRAEILRQEGLIQAMALQGGHGRRHFHPLPIPTPLNKQEILTTANLQKRNNVP
ncbi:hypothetical protein OKW28_008339 [Paraburkholderia sp. 40]